MSALRPLTTLFVDEDGWMRDWVLIVGPLLATFAGVAVIIGCLMACDENVFTGPVKGCVSLSHHDNHIFGIGDTQTVLRVYCEQT